MAEATLAGFRSRFPAFSGTADADANLALAEAQAIHNVRALAVYFLMAHILTLDSDDSNGEVPAGEVMSESAGPLRVAYRTQAERGTEAWYTATSFGKRALNLIKSSPRAAIGARMVS